MKKFLIQATLLILVVGIGIVFFNPVKGSSKFDIPFLPQQPKVANLQINDSNIKVEIADTPTKRSKGLGGRQSLGENEGMLFIFDNTDKHPFWMKGLKFPLDFVWIKGDIVIDITENVPSPSMGQSDSSLPVYTSSVEVDKVLEINGGAIKRFNIKAGDKISIK